MKASLPRKHDPSFKSDSSEVRPRSGSITQIATGLLDSPFGKLSVAATEDAVVLISLPDDSDYFQNRLQGLLPDKVQVKSNGVLVAAIAQLREYFQKKRRSFDVPYELYTTPFRRKVLRAVAAIPYGEVRSYGEIARLSGSARAARAVGSANATNTIPIIVPCHRVVASDGIGGYGGGCDLKKALLAHEGNTEFLD